MKVKQEDFYYYDTEEIVDKFYNGDIAKFSIELTEKLDKELEQLKAKYGQAVFIEKDINDLSDDLEKYEYQEQSKKLPAELKKELHKKIRLIGEMQKANRNRLYTEKEALALIFGEDYLNGTLPH